MNITNTINTIIGNGASPVLKATGFSKTNLNFHRRQKSVVQVVNFQLGQGNRGGDGEFYVNIGLAFDELWILQGHDLSGPRRKQFAKPLEHECHFRSRLEALVSDCPRWWVVASSQQHAQFFQGVSATQSREIAANEQEIERVAAYLGKCIQKVVIELDKIDGPRALIDHPWRQVPGNGPVVRQLASML